MSILQESEKKKVVRKGAVTKLPAPIQALVEQAFDSQAQSKYWENEFKASKGELVDALDKANYFDSSPEVQTSRGIVAIQQRTNDEGDLEKIEAALSKGTITIAQFIKCVKKVDVDKITTLLGHGYVKINPPTKFPVLRPGAGVAVTKTKVA